MTPVDVLIVGGGPAGAIAAITLARAGVDVCVLERSVFPRHKLCGDTVNPGVVAILRRLNLLHHVEPGALPIAGMIVSGARGVQLEGRYRNGARGLSLRRSDLDERLLQSAKSVGVRVIHGAVARGAMVSNGADGRRVDGVVARIEGRTVDMRARLTIAADGRRSTLAFGLGLAAHPVRPRRWAVGGYFADVQGLGDMGEMHIRPGGYIGVAPTPDGLANACYVSADRRGFDDPAALLASVLARDELLGARFATARPATPPTVIGPLAVDATSAGMSGLLLAGDAAGFVDPMTGDGLRFAIRGGELAAEAALLALADRSAHAHLTLARRYAREFAAKRIFNRSLRALVSSPWAVRAATTTAVRAPGALHLLVSIAGDVPSSHDIVGDEAQRRSHALSQR